MSTKIEDIGKTATRTTFNFYPNNIKIDKKSYSDILIYYIGYIKKSGKMNSVNPL